jgi:RNA polymerase sigma-70 factor (ECF subfamily)
MQSNFEAVISKYQNNTLKMLYRLTKDYTLSQDLLQETLLRAYHCEKSIDENKYQNWLLKIAKNIAIDYSRKSKRFRRFETDVTEISFNFGLDGFDYCGEVSRTEDTERYEYVQRLISQKFECCFLQKLEKMVLKYHYLKGFSYAKSAKMLHCSPVTVRRSYLSAIDKIRKYF